MIWCNSCKTVVWAYDQCQHMDIRGWLNATYMSCPVCGDKSNFDGWGVNEDKVEQVAKNMRDLGYKVFDRWSLMKAEAEFNKVKWDPSKDNQWFRPGTKLHLPSKVAPFSTLTDYK